MSDARFGKALIIGRVRIVRIQDQAAVGRLMQQDLPLGVDVILKVPVLIQMVGRNVGHHRDIRAAAHAVKLEGAELQHGDIVRADIRDLAQQGVSDIAAEVHPKARSLQELRQNCGGRGLPVAAGDGDHPAGAEGEKDLHLGREDAPACLCRLKMLLKGHEPRRAEQHILVKALQIIRAQLQLCPELFQLRRLFPHLLACAQIAGGHIAAMA